MIKILLRCDSSNPDFRRLVTHLDADLAVSDGAEHDFYQQFNKIDAIQHAIVLYVDEKAVGCGAIKKMDVDSIEVKRMYVMPALRGYGLASLVLRALENWASELGYAKCVLETGKKQPEAIRLYQKNGYQITANYGQYIGVENSICFEKNLK